MLTGENGILTNAKQAKILTEAGQIDEELKLATTVLNMEITIVLHVQLLLSIY